MKRILCFLLAGIFALSLFSCGKRVDIFAPTTDTVETAKSTVHTIETPSSSASPDELTPTGDKPTPTDGEPTPTPSTEVRPAQRFASLSLQEAAERFGKKLVYGYSEQYEFFLGKWCDSTVETLLKRDRETDVVSPVCIDSACTHSAESGCLLTNIDMCNVFGDDVYIRSSKSEYGDGARKETYKVFKYSMKTGEDTLIYVGSDFAGLLMSTWEGWFPLYRVTTRDGDFSALQTWYRITPSGESVEFCRLKNELVMQRIWKDKYFLMYELSNPSALKLVDIDTGEMQSVIKKGSYTGVMLADRYLMMYENINIDSDCYLFDLETGEKISLFQRSKFMIHTDTIIGRLDENGNILRIYNVKTGQEETYDLPDSITPHRVSSPYILDGIILFGEQSIIINGKRTHVYDLQIDLLSGRVRYRTEEIEVYSPDMPPYIVLEKEEVS